MGLVPDRRLPSQGPESPGTSAGMTGITAEVSRLVEQRAEGRCEYCKMHQEPQGATYHVEHIHPRSRGGDSNINNPAWRRPGCNLRKSDRVEMLDPISTEIVPLFHPRKNDWTEHFIWDRL
ncbi:HNH endonuclease [Singulisphaera rosea]